MKIPIKKILVPIDYQDDNVIMYHYALDMATALSAEVILFHVFGLSRDEIKDAEDLNAVGVWSLELIKEFKEENTPESYANIPISWMTEPGLTTTSINSIVEDENIDLIVMGTHGDQSSLEAFFGSITLSLINAAKIPIMVVPDDAPYQRIKKMIYTVNFEFQELKVIDQLLALTQALDAKLLCLHVLEDNEHINEIEENIEILESLYESHPQHKNLISFDIRVGAVKGTVARYAEEEAVDLVITRLKNPGWKLRTVESTSGSLVRKIDRPILVWK